MCLTVHKSFVLSLYLLHNVQENYDLLYNLFSECSQKGAARDKGKKHLDAIDRHHLTHTLGHTRWGGGRKTGHCVCLQKLIVQ